MAHSEICIVASLNILLGFGASPSENLSEAIDHLLKFQVTERRFFGTGKLLTRHGGSFLVQHGWQVKAADAAERDSGVELALR